MLQKKEEITGWRLVFRGARPFRAFAPSRFRDPLRQWPYCRPVLLLQTLIMVIFRIRGPRAVGLGKSNVNRQTLTTYLAAVLCTAALSTAARAGTVNIDLVPVGDVMNLADTATGYGAVSYAYSMGKYDVTTSQYTTFLNSVATLADPYSLYNSKMATDLPTLGITRTSTTAGFTYALKGNGNVPAFDVTWASAARFCNWLANAQPTGPEGQGTTETGSYTLNGSTGSAALMAVTRSTTASWV